MEDLVALWRARLRVLGNMPSEETKSIIYQLRKCIEDLEGQIEYERDNNGTDQRGN